MIASHAACNLTGDRQYPEYNLTDESIRRITELGGIIGLICSPHYLMPSTAVEEDQPECRDESLDLLCEHIERIRTIAPQRYGQVAIGSDLDVFIKPALRGLETIDQLAFLEAGLTKHLKDPEAAASVCSGSALTMLLSRFPAAPGPVITQ